MRNTHIYTHIHIYLLTYVRTYIHTHTYNSRLGFPKCDSLTKASQSVSHTHHHRPWTACSYNSRQFEPPSFCSKHTTCGKASTVVSSGWCLATRTSIARVLLQVSRHDQTKRILIRSGYGWGHAIGSPHSVHLAGYVDFNHCSETSPYCANSGADRIFGAVGRIITMAAPNRSYIKLKISQLCIKLPFN